MRESQSLAGIIEDGCQASGAKYNRLDQISEKLCSLHTKIFCLIPQNTFFFNDFDPKTSLLADGIADVILEDLALALNVLSLGKLAKICSLRLVALCFLTVKE